MLLVRNSYPYEFAVLLLFGSLLLATERAEAWQTSVQGIAAHGVEHARIGWQPTTDHLHAALPERQPNPIPVIPPQLDTIQSTVLENRVEYTTSHDNSLLAWIWQQHFAGVITIVSLALAIILVTVFWNRKLGREIVERKRIEQTLRENEEKIKLAASVFSHAREGILITGIDGTILDVNQAFTDITGYDKDEIIGAKPSVLKSGRQSSAFYEDMWESLKNEGYWSGELWNRRKNGNIYSEQLTISAVRNKHQELMHFIALFSDNTEKKKAEQELKESKHELEQEKLKAEQLARTDPLTGLNNRRAFFELGQGITEQSRRYHRVYSVIMLDVDHFKDINDRHGHMVGDEALVSVAKTIDQVIRTCDIPARVGGEEFAIILPETGLKEALLLAERLRIAFTSLELPLGSEGLSLTASFGVAESTLANLELDQVVNHADEAMYRAKNSGRNQVFEYIRESSLVNL